MMRIQRELKDLKIMNVAKAVIVLSLVLINYRPVVSADRTEKLPRIPSTDPSLVSKTFRLQDGFRLELIASEPLVTDPVAMTYDENGKAYVVEMNDYPYTDKSLDKAFEVQQSQPIGKVRLLEDSNGDGKFDKSTVFAGGISWPTGVTCWKGGVFVTATPDIWYFKDTNGDGRADVREKAFTGFRKYNVQAVMNNLKWGLDHKIYAAGSSNGGQVRPGDDPKASPVVFRRNDIRLDPQTKTIEALAGGARFGNCFDDWGNRFICNIRNPIQHIVMGNHYVKRNRYLNLSTTLNDVAESGDAVPVYRISPPEPWRVINAKRLASNFSSLRSPRSEMHATGFVTSASGITLYRGKAYPEKYYNNVFIGEVAGNLVVRYLLKKDGPTFKAHRAIDKEEFLASTDNWFRPVNFVNAPDGTLHVLDMYRETIEHPWSIPDDIKKMVDLESGRDKGRIYRLIPPVYQAGYPILKKPSLGSASIQELVKQLENPNSWWRETAHRLIFERQDKNAVPYLKDLIKSSHSDVGRLHAMWSLKGLDSLEESDLLIVLKDSSEHVRRQAVFIAETKINQSQQLWESVKNLVHDDSDLVRFQVALTLGQNKKNEAVEPLAEILKKDKNNFWIRTAVFSSMAGKEMGILEQLLKDSNLEEIAANQEMIGDLISIIGRRGNQEELNRLLNLIVRLNRDPNSTDSNSNPIIREMIIQLGKTLQRSGKFLLDPDKKFDPEIKTFLDMIAGLTLETASNSSLEISDQKQSVELLGFIPFTKSEPVWKELLNSSQSHEIQKMAVASLVYYRDTEVSKMILDQYSSMTPDIQRDMVAILLRRTNLIVPLFQAIKERKVASGQISSIHRTIFMKHSNKEIRQLALELFKGDVPGPRSDVIKAYQGALTLKGDLKQGQKIFEKECMICHKMGQKGFDVGPNLVTVKNRTSSEILTHILDPNREVSPNYQEYVIATVDGQIKTGIISAETPTGITLKIAEGKTELIPRTDIENLSATGKSLMPEGLEKKITKKQMADLIYYVLLMRK
jgi:putative membrane-bound dehydrogenase-like protein